MRRRRDYSWLIALAGSLVINTGMIGVVAWETIPPRRVSIAAPAPRLAHGIGASTQPSIVALPETFDEAMLPPPATEVVPDKPPVAAPKVKLLPPPPPKMVLDPRDEFGENHGTGQALDTSPGAQPLQGHLAQQIQAFLSRSHADRSTESNQASVNPAPGGGDDGQGGAPGTLTPANAAQSPAQASQAARANQADPTPVALTTPHPPAAPKQAPSSPNDAPSSDQPPAQPLPKGQEAHSARQGPLASPPPPAVIASSNMQAAVKPAQMPDPVPTGGKPIVPVAIPPNTSDLDKNGSSAVAPLPVDDFGNQRPRPDAAPKKPDPAIAQPAKTIAAAQGPNGNPSTQPSFGLNLKPNPVEIAMGPLAGDFSDPVSAPARSAPPPSQGKTPDAKPSQTPPATASPNPSLTAPPQAPQNPAVAARPTPYGNNARSGRPGQHGPSADVAPPSDKDSDPFSDVKAVHFVNGRVDARDGRWVKTVKPHITDAGMIDAMGLSDPSVTFLATVDTQGNVIRVSRYKSSGSDNIDLPCERALNEWKIEPSRDASGKPVADVVPVTFDMPR